MKLYQSLTLAFAMYSKIPMPYVEWDEDSMRWVFFCFPLVGAVIGGALWLWLTLCLHFAFGKELTALGALVLPLWISGGIHLDGLCDTCDALGSHQPRERKLEILKDSRIGAFGVMGCVVYLIALYAGLSALELTGKAVLTLCLNPILSRSFSGLMAVSCPNARGSGLLFTFTGAHTNGWNRVLLVLWLLIVSGLMAAMGGGLGICAALAMLVVTAYYLHMSRKEFGGITGDLEGWYLQLLELAAVLAVAVAEKVLV